MNIPISRVSDNLALNLAMDTLKINKQALVFAGTKPSCEKLAEDIAGRIPSELPALSDMAASAEHALSTPTKQCKRLASCLRKGIAFHHAGLTASQRELVENNFRSGLIKIICCTPTLCLSKDAMVWHNMSETEVSKLKSPDPLFVLSKNKLISMKPQKVNRIMNSSKLVQISSVSGHSVKVTPNHQMLIKRKDKRLVVKAADIRKSDKIATVGRLDINNALAPDIRDFVVDNRIGVPNYKFGPKLSCLIGLMLGGGYSGAETNGNNIRYKGSPTIVGIDNEVFLRIQEFCNQLKLNCRKTKTFHGTPQLVLGKNKWFREFLVRCGIEKRDKKHISERLMVMNLENISALVRGLFDTDGYLEKKAGPGFSSVSERLTRQIQKLLLRFGIISAIRRRKSSSMRIYGKEYKTLPCFELSIHQKKSIIDFYKFIGFGIKRKQESLIDLIAKIFSNLNYVSCNHCKYKIYRDVFSGRTKDQKMWWETKLKVIKTLGERGELGSRELKRILGDEPKKKDCRLNHHYELIKKRRMGSRSNTEWFWSLNPAGNWIFDNVVNKNKKIEKFFGLKNCPLCENELNWFVKKGWRDSDFEGDIFWDKIRGIKGVDCEREVYDVVLPNKKDNEHMFVANGFIVHNSMGVDIPAFRSIIKDLKRFGEDGMGFIPVLEYLQMAGRAGRPRFDKEGQAIILALTETEKEKLTEKYINGAPEAIESKLAVEPVLRTFLLSLIASDFVSTAEDILGFFGRTFWAAQYGDMRELRRKIENMLDELAEWEFLESSEDAFVSASQIGSATYQATKVGKRVAELYLDPFTARGLILAMHKAAKSALHDVPLLHMLSCTLEMRPLLRVRAKEIDVINEELAQYEGTLFVPEPSIYEPEYDDYLNGFKTALFMKAWIEEKDEEFLLETFNIRPGEIRTKLDIADWLSYTAIELAKLLQFREAEKALLKLRFRLKNGVKEELLPLIRLKNIGRVRARRLFRNGIKDIGDVKKADLVLLSQLLGKAVAVDVKKQVGQDNSSVGSGPQTISKTALNHYSSEGG